MSVVNDTLRRLKACGWTDGMSAKALAALKARLKQQADFRKRLGGVTVEQMYTVFGEFIEGDEQHDYDRLPDQDADPEWWLRVYERVSDGVFRATETKVSTVKGKKTLSFTYGGKRYEHKLSSYTDIRGVVNRALRESGEKRSILNTYPADDSTSFVFVSLEAFKAAQADGLIPSTVTDPFTRKPTPWRGPTTGE